MGLRERNAAQTRELILDTAIDLFRAHGYDATRMEEIAERAEIGTSTLYRYFPTKDELVIGPLALRGQMAEALLERPDDEPLDLALGHALVALLTTPRPDTERIRVLALMVETTPALQSRLLEVYDRERTLLGTAVATRLGREPDDLFCVLTARVATLVLELIGSRSDQAATPADNESAVRHAVETLRGLLDAMHREPPVLPRLG